VAGLDIPSKLRRALGGGKPISAEQLSAKLAAFDKDQDGALTRDELAQAFVAFGCGGPWFCAIMARNVWTFCEMVVPPPINWIKITLLGPALAQFMQQQPRKAKRVAITPAGAYGWEPLYYTDGTPVDPNAVSIPELPSKYDALPPPARTAAPSTPPPAPAPAATAPRPGSMQAPAGVVPRAAPSAAPRGPQAPAGRAPAAAPGRPAPTGAPARPAPPTQARRPGPRR